SAAAAATRADEAATSAAAAEDARMEAVEAADNAGGYVLTASADAATATTQAGLAAAGATQAAGHAGDAESSRLAAEDARDDVLYARGQAEASAVTATTQAGIATTRATEATTAKNEAVTARAAAQAAAASFGLSAGTVTTGSPSSSASVSVTGAGPAYTLNFTIPRGAQGLQGPQGTGLQIQNRLATYALLPTGLGSGDAGKAWIVDADGLLYIWNGTAFPVSGDGLNLVGARGNDGLTAYQVAQSNGFVGSASEWLDSLVGDPGSAGLSAYEIAQAAGFVGSESAWLDSLKGADGATEWDALANKPTVFPPVIGTGAADAKAGDWMPQWSDVKSKPSTYPPTIGPGATQAVAGNDPRLSDARTPVEHSASLLTSGTLDSARLPAITSAMITDGTLVDADISSSAAIGKTKLAAPVQTSLGNADKAQITYGVCGKDTARAVGAGDNVLGIRLAQAVTINSFFARCVTADASGNLVIELRKNGTSVSGTSHSIASGSQVAGAAKTGLSAAFAVGDILTVHITGVGGTPGQGLTVDLAGVCD
ncbi:MAG: hypothetical protein WAZ19_01095, partial [Anaerolineae bacterium]